MRNVIILWICVLVLNFQKSNAQTYISIEEYTDSMIILSDSSTLVVDSVILPIKVEESIPTMQFANIPYEDVVKAADSTGKPYFLEFYASWCGPCKLMEKEVFGDERIINYSNHHFHAKRIDVDDFDGIPIVQRFQVTSLPTIILFNCNGTVKKRLEGMYEANYFLQALKSVR